MDITLALTPDADRRRRMYQIVNSRTQRLSWAGGSVFLVAGVLLVAFGFANHSVPAESGSRGLILAGGLYFYIPLLLTRRAAGKPTTLEEPVIIRLTDTEAVTETSRSHSSLDWSALSRVDERSGFWIAYAGRRPLFTLPQESMTPEQVTEFRGFLARRTAPPQLKPASEQ